MGEVSSHILSDIKPVNLLRGKDTIFYLDGNRAVHVEVPQLYCTKRTSYANATKWRDQLLNYFETNNIPIESRLEIPEPTQSGFGEQYYVLWAKGNRGFKWPKELGTNRLAKSSKTKALNLSITKALRYAYPIFSKVEVVNLREENGVLVADQIIPVERASIEELVNLPTLAIDIETDKDRYNKSLQGITDDNYTRINTISLVYDCNGKIVEEVKSIFDEDVGSQEKLVSWLNETIRTVQPFYICSHNIAYDLLRTHKISGQFFPGVDDSAPLIKGVISSKKKSAKGVLNGEVESFEFNEGLVIPHVYGRQSFCSYAFARNWLWLSSNKLEQVSNFSLPEPFEKGMFYADLEELIYEIDSGKAPKSEMNDVKQYCLNDAMQHFKLFKRYLPTALKLAEVFDTDVERVSTRSSANLCEAFFDKRYFDNLKTVRPYKNELSDVDLLDEKIRLLRQEDEHSVGLPIVRKKDHLRYPITVAFPSFFGDIFARYLDAKKIPQLQILKGWALDSDNPVNKILLSEGLDEICAEPLMDVRAKRRSSFRASYGSTWMYIEAELENTVKKFKRSLDYHNIQIVNYKGMFLFLKGNSDVITRLSTEDKGLIVYGVSPGAISLGADGIIVSVNGNLISPGVSVFRRRGRTNFESDTIYRLSDLVLQRQEHEAYMFLENQCEDFFGNKVDPRDLIIATTIGQYVDEFSRCVYNRSRLEIIRRLEQDLEVKFLPETELNKLEILRHLGKVKHQLKNEEIKFAFSRGGKEVLADEFLEQKLTPDFNIYRKMFFGIEGEHARLSEGSISRIAVLVWPNLDLENVLFRGAQKKIIKPMRVVRLDDFV